MRTIRLSALRRCRARCLLSFMLLFVIVTVSWGQGLPNQAWPAGTVVYSWANINVGGRVGTWHRGYLYMHAQRGNGHTSIWNIANLPNPVEVRSWNVGANGHFWWKIGDMYRRAYDMPEITGGEWADLSNMPNPVAWTKPAPFAVNNSVNSDRVSTFPFAYYGWANQMVDFYRGTTYPITVGSFPNAGLNLQKPMLIGNLWIGTPQNGSGMVCWDVSNPGQPVLKKALNKVIQQYGDGLCVWKHYVIILSGDNSNDGGRNVIAVDFSDPANMDIAFGFSTQQVGSGRYMMTQDEYGFMSGGGFRKINLETKQVQTFNGPSVGDFWPQPIGHLIVYQSGQNENERAAIMTHQSTLDTRRPYVNYHVPANGQTNYSRFTGIGIVINETLRDETINDQTIQVAPCGGAPLQGTAVRSSYGTIQWVPAVPLDPNTTYKVTFVQDGIKDAAGNGIDEYSFTFSTGGTVASNCGPGGCQIPGGLATSGITTTAATVSWSSVASAANYDVRYRQVGSPTWININNLTVTSTTLTGLTADVNYEWQVRTSCGGSDSQYSSSVTFSTAGGPCNTPSGLASSDVTASSASLTWTAQGNAQNYDVRYRVSGTTPWTEVNDQPTATASLNGLASETLYEWQVRTSCSSGNSAYSGSQTFNTLAPGQSQTVEGENFAAQTGCSVRSDIAGFLGTGFLDFGGNGSFAEWSVNVPSAGSYTLTFRYANGSAVNRQCALSVNGGASLGNIAFTPTGAWTTWTITPGLNATLNAGSNTIRLTANTGNGGPNLDQVIVTGEAAPNNLPEITAMVSDPEGTAEVHTQITFIVTATDEDNDPLEYIWDFNDGTITGWSATNDIVTHTYDNPGNYTVQVQVRDDNPDSEVGEVLQLTITVPFGIPPTRSSPIALDALARKVWVVNPDNNTVSVIHADNLTKDQEIPVGADPTGVALANGKVWVSCRDSDQIYVLSAVNGSLITTINLDRGARPYHVVPSPDGNEVYVSEFGRGRITKLNASTNSVVSSLPVGPTPRVMAIDGDANFLYVTRFISDNTQGDIWKVSLSSFTVSETLEIILDDFSPVSGVEGQGIPNYVSGIVISPDNASMWTTAKKDNILRGNFLNGENLTFETTIRSLMSKFTLSTGLENFSSRLDFDDFAQPSAVSFSPSGNQLLFTMQGNNMLIAADPFTGAEIVRTPTGLAPQGLVVDPATARVFVKNFMGRTVTVLDGNVVFSGQAAPMPELATINTVATELLSPQVLLGKQIFYNADDIRMTQQGNEDNGYLSCATCHIDGTHDGRAWDFTQRGEGMRNTTNLRGRAGTGHGRVHWSANFDEIHDFENDMRNAFAGNGFLSDTDFANTQDPLGPPKAGLSSDLDALSAYLESLDTFDPSPFRNLNGTLTADAVAGKTIFQNLNCATCHNGADFTDSDGGLMHDVGTIGLPSGQRRGHTLLGIDVPTLRDVWATPPYLHDGSAATLVEVFTKHVGTESLTTTQRNQLVAYLQQIDSDEPAPAGAALQLTLTSPVAGATLTEGAPATLSINTTIAGISEVRYYVDGTQVASSATAPYSASWTPAAEGEHLEVHAKVFHGTVGTVSLGRFVDVETSVVPVDDVYEGEDNTSSNDGFVATNFGTTYFDFGGNGSFLEWNIVDVPATGTYTLTFRYGNGSAGNRQCALSVNSVGQGNIAFAANGDWSVWQTTSVAVTLNEGLNTVRLTVNTSAGGPNFDYMRVQNAAGAGARLAVRSAVSEISEESRIIVSPNPVSGVVTIRGVELPVDVQISNLIGQRVKSVTTRDGRVDVSDLSRGIYLIRVNNRVIRMIKQ